MVQQKKKKKIQSGMKINVRTATKIRRLKNIPDMKLTSFFFFFFNKKQNKKPKIIMRL